MDDLNYVKLRENLSVQASRIVMVERLSDAPIEVRVGLDLPAPDNAVLLDGIDAERVWATYGVSDTNALSKPMQDYPLTAYYNIFQN